MTSFPAVVQQISPIMRGWFGQQTLAAFGIALLGLVPVGAVWAWRDPRLIGGESVALKPARFALSIGIYLLTASAMFEYIRPERRSAMLPCIGIWMMIVGSTVELSCIALQAARARQSHFNTATPADAAIYAMMGAFAVLFLGALLPIAWEIARRPNEQLAPLMAQAIVAGLLITVVAGGGIGALMSAKGCHTIGAEERGLPLLGWSITGRDIRVPHFLGIHAMQGLPMIAAGATVFSPERRGSLFVVGAVAYCVLTAWLLHRALSVRPIER